MTNHRLSVEQKFNLESTFCEIDACQDIEQLRQLTKQIITAQENEKAEASAWAVGANGRRVTNATACSVPTWDAR